MMEIRRIYPWDKHSLSQVKALLAGEDLGLDEHLDYTAGIWEDELLLATGSFYRNTLRCLAVNRAYQGEGLMARMVSHLVDEQFQRGQRELFIYTKKDAAQNFTSLGF